MQVFIIFQLVAFTPYTFINVPWDKHKFMMSQFNKRGLFGESPTSVITSLPTDQKCNNCNNRIPRIVFGEIFHLCRQVFYRKSFPLVLGEDCACSTTTIFAANEYCQSQQKCLGIVFFQTNPSINPEWEKWEEDEKDTYGSDILCHKDSHHLIFGPALDTSQFFYCDPKTDIDDLLFWLKMFDCIHFSWNLKDEDRNFLIHRDYINTLFKHIKHSKKLISADIVNYKDSKQNTEAIVEVATNLFE